MCHGDDFLTCGRRCRVGQDRPRADGQLRHQDTTAHRATFGLGTSVGVGGTSAVKATGKADAPSRTSWKRRWRRRSNKPSGQVWTCRLTDHRSTSPWHRGVQSEWVLTIQSHTNVRANEGRRSLSLLSVVKLLGVYPGHVVFRCSGAASLGPSLCVKRVRGNTKNERSVQSSKIQEATPAKFGKNQISVMWSICRNMLQFGIS